METAQLQIPVELYGVPRILAGARRIEVAGTTLAELAVALGRACPALRGPVLDETTGWLCPGYTFVVDGRFTRQPATPISQGADVLLVSSAAGG